MKKESTLAGYLLDAYLLDSFDNVNFVDNDGVNTTYVCNTDTNPDYIVVANGDVISSRWYVIEKSILRNGQYRFTLRRDVIVDAYESAVSAPCFIEKATLQKNDPLIFNGEDMTVNQIKTSEYALKDETGCAWVVGYIPKDSFNGEEASRTVNTDFILTDATDIVVENIDAWEYYLYITQKFNSYYTEEPVFAGRAAMADDGFNRWTQWGSQGTSLDLTTAQYNRIYALVNEVVTSDLTLNNMAYVGIWGTVGTQQKAAQNWAGAHKGILQSALATTLGLHTTAQTSTFLGLNGKTIYDSTNKKYYRIRVEGSLVRNTQNVTTSMPQLYNTMSSTLVRDCGDVDIGGAVKNIQITGTPGATSFAFEASYYEYNVYLDQYTVSANVVISAPENRYHLEDQPYDMFCIPYSDSLKIYQNGVQLTTASSSLAINLATQIGASTGSGNVYDIQLLPYCPVRYCILEDGTFDIKSSKHDKIKDSSGNTLGVVLWATTSAFTLNILHEIVVTDPKIESQTDVYRLTSPNFNGQFEFNAAKNGGVESFNVDCNYKPFNPYIHVNPNFKLLYGQDFNDARGLICGGDFSLPQLSNAWANYQLENKNYQAIFDRQIQNMEVNNKVQRQKEIISAAIGTAQGGLMGAASGMQYGPGAAIAGGVGGTLASLAGGIADVNFNEQLRNEALDYTKDMYGYNLGNIQALPTSLTKTSAFTYNNKIFPILEYYTCTDQEKQALRDKIKYNGMTVMRIGTIAEFIPNAEKQYIKGRIIRLEGIEEDYHFLKAISEEIFKGAFFS